MRWSVEIIYRTDQGENVVDHYVEELGEIEEIVERGPDWNAIEQIRIDLIRISTPGLTVEGAERI